MGKAHVRFISQFKRIDTNVTQNKSLARNHARAESLGIDKQCPRCKRKLKHPEHDHYSDIKNKTPCLSFKV